MQGWEEVDGRSLQVCAACNLAWLDTTFQLAPEASLDSGNILHLNGVPMHVSVCMHNT